MNKRDVLEILNYIAQIIVAILYSGIYGVAVVYISLSPLLLVGRLSSFWIFTIIFFGSGLIMGLQVWAQSIISAPYIWIADENIVAKIISAVIILGTGVWGVIKLWIWINSVHFSVFLGILITIDLMAMIIGSAYMIYRFDDVMMGY